MRKALILTIVLTSLPQFTWAQNDLDNQIAPFTPRSVVTDDIDIRPDISSPGVNPTSRSYTPSSTESQLLLDRVQRFPELGRNLPALLFGNQGEFGSLILKDDPFDNRPGSGAFQRMLNGLSNPHIIIGTDFYTGGALGTLANPGLSLEIQVPVFEDWERLSNRRAFHRSLTAGFDFTHAFGNDKFQLNEPQPGGVQAEVDGINIYGICTDLQVELIIRPEQRRARKLIWGAGLDLGTINADIETTTFDPNKTQFFVPLGTGVAELQNDFFLKGELTGGAGFETDFGQINILLSGFLMQTGAVSGFASNTTGLSVGVEWKWGGLPGDFDRNGVVDAGDYSVWRNNLGQETQNPAFEDGMVDQEDYDVWRANFGATQ